MDGLGRTIAWCCISAIMLQIPGQDSPAHQLPRSRRYSPVNAAVSDPRCETLQGWIQAPKWAVGSERFPVTSPGFRSEQPYPTFLRCKLTLEALPGDRVRLQFTTFDLEPSEGCWADCLEVYDGYLPQSEPSGGPDPGDGEVDASIPLLGTFCGDTLPPLLLSSGPNMTLVLLSDESVTGQGFRALAQFI